MKKKLLFIFMSFTVFSCHKDNEKCDSHFLTQTIDSRYTPTNYYYNTDGTLSYFEVHEFDYEITEFYYENKKLIRVELGIFSTEKFLFTYDHNGLLSYTLHLYTDGYMMPTKTDSITFEYDSDNRIIKRNHFLKTPDGVSYVDYSTLEYSGRNPTKVNTYKMPVVTTDPPLYTGKIYEYDINRLPYPNEMVLLNIARNLDVSENNILATTNINDASSTKELVTYQYDDKGYPTKQETPQDGFMEFTYSCSPQIKKKP